MQPVSWGRAEAPRNAAGPPPPAPQPLSSPGDHAQGRPLRHLSINRRYLCSPRPRSAPAPALPGPPPPPSTVRPSLLPTSGSASQTPRSVSRHVTKPPMKLPWPLLLNPSPGPPAGAGPTLPCPPLAPSSPEAGPGHSPAQHSPSAPDGLCPCGRAARGCRTVGLQQTPRLGRDTRLTPALLPSRPQGLVPAVGCAPLGGAAALQALRTSARRVF